MENITYKIDWVIVNENPDRNKQGRYVYIFESDHELTRLLDTIETAVRHGDYTGKPWMERVYLTDNTLYEIWIDTETGNVQWNREDFSYMEKIQ